MSSCKSYGSNRFTKTDDNVEDTFELDGFGGLLCNVLEGSGEKGISSEDGNIFSVDDLLGLMKKVLVQIWCCSCKVSDKIINLANKIFARTQQGG